MSRIEIVVGHVEIGIKPWSLADKLHDTFKKKGDSKIDVINSRGQVVTTVKNTAQLIYQNIAHVQIANMKAHYTVAVLTSSRIIVDLHKGLGIKPGDVLSLVGNVSGEIGTITALAGRTGPSGFTVITALSVSRHALHLVDKHIEKLDYFYSRAVNSMIDLGREEGYIDKDALIVPPGGSGTFAVFDTDEGDSFFWSETVIGGAFSSPLPSNNPGASPGYDGQFKKY